MEYNWIHFLTPKIMILEKALRYMSSFFSLFGAYLILSNKELQTHPYRIYAIMMIVDSGNFLQFDLAQDIYRSNEYIDIPNVPMLGYYVFLPTQYIIENKYQILAILYCSNQQTQAIFFNTFYSINFGLAWDLINSVRDPFESNSGRYNKILLFSPFLFFLQMGYWITHLIFNITVLGEPDPSCGTYRYILMLAPLIVTIEITFTLYAIYAIILSGKGLLRKGQNHEMKQNFFKRQFAYFLIIILSNAAYTVFLTQEYIVRETKYSQSSALYGN